MSNALAIAAVTTSLLNLDSTDGVDPALNLPSGIGVTAQPPDAANSDTNPRSGESLSLSRYAKCRVAQYAHTRSRR